MTTVAETVAHELSAWGVNRVFGLPGGEVLYLLDAAREAGIEFTLTRHEANAGFAAAVYGKLTGKPGVAVATLGPGAANLALPIANATLDREPLLAITAQLPATHPESHTHQRLALEDMYRPLTKLTGKLDTASAVSTLRWAIEMAVAQPKGAVHLSLSADMALQEYMGPGGGAVRESFDASFPEEPMDAAIEHVLDKIERAERPVLLIGLGARPDLSPTLNHLMRLRGIPTMVTPKVKGIVDELDQAFVGVAGGMAADDLMLEVLNKADLIVGLGFDPVEVDKTWHAELPIAYVLESPNACNILPRDAVLVRLDRFVDAWAAQPLGSHQWTVEDPFIEDVKERYRRRLEDRASEFGIWPGSVLRALADVFPAEGIVTTDVGAHKFLFGQFWRSTSPQTFFMSNGLSGMGYGLPAALGAKLARPTAPVMAVVGDGGFAMNSQELETMARTGVPVIVLVLADNALSLIKLSQENKKLRNYGVDFGRIDPVLTAQACGVGGVRAENAGVLQKAVEEALQRDAPAVVEVPVDYRDYRHIF